MPEELKPAHDVLVEEAAVCCANIQRLNHGTEMALEIGALCGHLKVLQKMFIPEKALPGVISKLKKLPYNHAAVTTAIHALTERGEG